MKEETYNKAQHLYYRISRFNNLIQAFKNKGPYNDIALGDKKDELEFIQLCECKIEILKKEIEEL